MHCCTTASPVQAKLNGFLAPYQFDLVPSVHCTDSKVVCDAEGIKQAALNVMLPSHLTCFSRCHYVLVVATHHVSGNCTLIEYDVIRDTHLHSAKLRVVHSREYSRGAPVLFVVTADLLHVL